MAKRIEYHFRSDEYDKDSERKYELFPFEKDEHRPERINEKYTRRYKQRGVDSKNQIPKAAHGRIIVQVRLAGVWEV